MPDVPPTFIEGFQNHHIIPRIIEFLLSPLQRRVEEAGRQR
jgi:hypothetical protein